LDISTCSSGRRFISRYPTVGLTCSAFRNIPCSIIHLDYRKSSDRFSQATTSRRVRSCLSTATVVPHPGLDNDKRDDNLIDHVLSFGHDLKMSMIPTTRAPHIVFLVKFGNDFIRIIYRYELDGFNMSMKNVSRNKSLLTIRESIPFQPVFHLYFLPSSASKTRSLHPCQIHGFRTSLSDQT
jgi:hypothetical protein